VVERSIVGGAPDKRSRSSLSPYEFRLNDDLVRATLRRDCQARRTPR
jgi:hypothetical protein